MLRTVYRNISFLSRGFVPLPIGPVRQLMGRAKERLVVPGKSDSWFVVAPEASRLHPNFESIVMAASRHQPDARIFYSDEAVHYAGESQPRLLTKPSFSLSLLMIKDYVGLPLIVHAATFRQLGGLRFEARSAATYDLLLRAASAGVKISRIPVALMMSSSVMPPVDETDRTAVLGDWLASPPLCKYPEHLQVTLIMSPPCEEEVSERTVSERLSIGRFLSSLAHSSWRADRFGVLIGGRGTNSSSVLSDFPYEIRYVAIEDSSCKPLDYGAKMNALWQAAESDYIVFVNYKLSLEPRRWLNTLLSFAAEEDVGGAIARPLRGTGGFRYCGIDTDAEHDYTGVDVLSDSAAGDKLDPRDRTCCIANDVAFATRRSLLELVDGLNDIPAFHFDENAGSCLRLRLLGYRIARLPLPIPCQLLRPEGSPAAPRSGEPAY